MSSTSLNENRVEALKPLKKINEHNPLITQAFSADPYALVFEGRLYLYMTGDKHMYDENGKVIVNNYSNIDTLHVISSDDLVNWTDHGEINAAGVNGEARWGGNSWAPAACVKYFDGKPKFFLYFANSGNGIAVLTADSPTGPFTDPLGEAIISRDTPTCAEVTWLFDPAVLVDEDGKGYIYFGGGVPCDEKIHNPGTARMAKLTDDMIHLDGDPVPIKDVLYLFEDSGINRIGDKYIYSYCSNFDVPKTGCEKYGFEKGEIVTMVSDSPMGPFETVGGILKNPEYFFEYGGNNHHCMFQYEGKWYVTYHASLAEERIGECLGYRNVNIDRIEVGEDGLFAPTKATREGVEQLKVYNPYAVNSFTTMSNQAGIKVVPRGENEICYGDMNLCVAKDGAFIQVTGVDMGDGADIIKITVKKSVTGSVSVRLDSPDNEDVAVLDLDVCNEITMYDLKFECKLDGKHDLFFVFKGEGTELISWEMMK